LGLLIVSPPPPCNSALEAKRLWKVGSCQGGALPAGLSLGRWAVHFLPLAPASPFSLASLPGSGLASCQPQEHSPIARLA
jgi:hypothetical protein